MTPAGASSPIDLAAVSQVNLTEYNREIARWTRLSGSAEERSAAAYAEERLRGFGYRTQVLVHDAYISLPGPAALPDVGAAVRPPASRGLEAAPDGTAPTGRRTRALRRA